jgi:hypothetical protein
MKTPFLLHIPEPCHENWDAMTPQDKGRHCQSCNKIVVDFSVMSDRQVLEYFKTTTGKTCGRFHDDQLQRPLIEPKQKSSRWNYFVASVFGFFMTGKLVAQDRMILGKVIAKPPVKKCVTKGETVEAKKDTNHIKTVGDTIYQKLINNPTSLGDKLPDKQTKLKEEEYFEEKEIRVTLGGVSSIEYIAPKKNILKGLIVDEKNLAIVGASITLKGTRLGTASDLNGAFELKKLGASKLTLIVSSIGFETKEIEVVPKDLKVALKIILKEKKNELEEVILQASYGTIGKIGFMGSVTSISCKKIKPSIKDSTIKIIQKIFNRESIKFYPNPATKNDIIHITIKDAGEYALHFFDTSSRLLTVKNIVTNTNNQTTEFQLPSFVTTGTYFIRILNEKTQKQVTEKIVVQ